MRMALRRVHLLPFQPADAINPATLLPWSPMVTDQYWNSLDRYHAPLKSQEPPDTILADKSSCASSKSSHQRRQQQRRFLYSHQ